MVFKVLNWICCPLKSASFITISVIQKHSLNHYHPDSGDTMQIWLTVTILLAALLSLHAYYLRRDYRSLLKHWSELDNALHERHIALQNITATLPALNEKIAADLNILLQRPPDTHPKRWLQRAALESRLSLQTEQALKQIGITTDIANQMNHLDNAIQLALSLFQISANRYNHRHDSFPGNMLSALTGLSRAPDFEIEIINIPS
jgi:hypothetical protein